MIEPFIAPLKRTNERLFASVDPHVSLQIKIKGKSLVAKFTLVWFLTLFKHELCLLKTKCFTYRMYKHMPFKLRIVEESFTASFVCALE